MNQTIERAASDENSHTYLPAPTGNQKTGACWSKITAGAASSDPACAGQQSSDGTVGILGKDASATGRSTELRSEGNKSAYRFPQCPVFQRYRRDLRDRNSSFLVKLLKHVIESRVTDEQLLKARPLIAAAHIALNDLGTIPPGFRPRVRCQRNKLSGTASLVSNDLQVVDLHWLYTWHRSLIKPDAREKKVSKLMSADEFSYEMAAEIVATIGRAATKVEALNIPSPLQQELAKLQSPLVRAQIEIIDSEVVRMAARLGELALLARSRLAPGDIDKRLIEFRCLKLANGSPLLAARLLRQQTAGPNDAEAIRQLADTLRKRRSWFEQRLNYTNWKFEHNPVNGK